jgi:AcrR family transcriptional regulator
VTSGLHPLETQLKSPAETAGGPVSTTERILAAAREVIARKGKRGATTREIADVAGLNEATLFRHFGSKEALIIAVAQRYCGAVELKSVAEQLPGNLEEDLFLLGRTMLTHMESVRDMMRWSLVEEDVDESVFASTTWRPQRAIHGVITEYLAGRVASGELRGDPRHLGLVFMGFLFSHVMARKKFDLEELYGSSDTALRYYIQIFLGGVRTT